MESQIVFSQIDDIKRRIAKELKNKKWNHVLNLVSLCANILYWSNPYYKDQYLENTLREVSKHLSIDISQNSDSDCESILVYDGFGLNNRGLIQIYLKALCPKYKVTYVTFQHRAKKIPDIMSVLKEYQSDIEYLDKYKDSKTKQISRLGTIVNKKKIGKIFCYCLPEDVICNTLMYALNGKVERYRINLTDHAFWLGSECVDKCVEFREYGACISKEYREIEKDKIHIIPFYPIIPQKTEFQGFPFHKENSPKVIFSGGLLYKTFGDNNRYYKMVNTILLKYDNVIFWYAGSGDDSEIQKLIRKYPQRVFLTSERADLFSLLEKVDIYLSTYPFSGGLMYQYAALAGKVPVTLKKDETTDGFLLNQKELGIEFNTEEEVYSEIDKLLSDEKYFTRRSQEIRKAVVTEKDFNQNVWNMINHKDLSNVAFNHVDTVKFRELAMHRMSTSTYEQCFALESFTILRYYPIHFIRGWKYKIMAKIS